MVIFWFICALMVLMALWFVLPALWQTAAKAKANDARVANLLVYQDQLRELEADLNAGLLSEAQYGQDKEELERRLLDDIGEAKSTSPSRQVGTRKLAYALAVAIPLAAVLFYFAIGSPKGLDASAVTPPIIRSR